LATVPKDILFGVHLHGQVAVASNEGLGRHQGGLHLHGVIKGIISNSSGVCPW
jgi:hypothetical protein